MKEESLLTGGTYDENSINHPIFGLTQNSSSKLGWKKTREDRYLIGKKEMIDKPAETYFEKEMNGEVRLFRKRVLATSEVFQDFKEIPHKMDPLEMSKSNEGGKDKERGGSEVETGLVDEGLPYPSQAPEVEPEPEKRLDLEDVQTLSWKRYVLGEDSEDEDSNCFNVYNPIYAHDQQLN
jgi:hypothetical protein